MFIRGSLVWGKMKTFPWWPAIVIDPEDCGRDRIQNNKLWLFWFCDHKITEVPIKFILDFEKYFKEKSSHMKGKNMEKAILEILTVSAEHHQFQCTDFSALLSWANNGFKTSSGIFYERVNKELPDVVLQTLKKDIFQRKEVVECDRKSYGDEDICEVIDMVRKGSTALEDICIICCKFPSLVSMEHPLFIGGVCQNCKKCVDKINKTDFGQMQEICVICSQGGNLVYCCNDICLRSYCELCLEYMVCKGSYLKVVENENWDCYLCKPDPDKNCLIKRRIKYHAKIIPTPAFPLKKLPISVIAENDAAGRALEKNTIQIAAYFTVSAESSSANSQAHFIDFSKDEFRSICADLVYGSFFTTLDGTKSCFLMFSAAFYKFLYRLDNAKLYKSTVFFIFISNARLNSEVLSRVIRFLQVEPYIVQIQEKEFYVWTNVPRFCCEISKYSQHKVDGNDNIEEEILSLFLKPLKDYFEFIE